MSGTTDAGMARSESFAAFQAKSPDATLTQWLQARAQPAWDQAVKHRFTRELAENSLPDAVYSRYLVQDYAFIDTLVRVVALTISEAPGMPPKSRLAGFLAAITSEENDYFLRSFEALGVDEATWREAEPNYVTARLEAVMLEAARSGGYPACLTLLLATEWVYQSWASDCATFEPERFYLREWIALHIDPGFTAFVAWLREEVDRTLAPLPSDRLEDLAALFVRMVALEVAFFDAAYES